MRARHPTAAFAAALLLLLLLLPAAHAASGRADVAARTAQLLRERYLDAALGAKLADALLAKQEELDRIADPQAYAAAVTRTMQDTVPDLHLRMSYEPGVEFVPGAAEGQAGGAVRRTGRIDGRDTAAIARTNFGFDAVERLDGNIGYLRLSRFVPLALSQATAAAAMQFLANSDALIVDVRGNIGGAPDTVAFLLDHLFAPDAAPLLLHASENRAAGARNEIRTDPQRGNARLAKAPVYVLTDRRSASAAEMLAYAGQRSGRVKLVGETTAGAGNGGLKHSVGQGYALFVAEWKVLTGPGWERTGVRPDIETAPADALPAARKLALEALLRQADTPALREERARALKKL